MTGGSAQSGPTECPDRQSRERFGEWASERARDQAAEGLPATIAALREGGVAEVLLARHLTPAADIWIGPAGAELAVSAAELSQQRVGDPLAERADAALARGLATTDAGLHFLPEDLSGASWPAAGDNPGPPQDGICALLRYPAAELADG